MATPTESAPATGETRPTIETIGEAAAEITRLYVALDKTAVDLTDDYLQGRLAGEEGVTWEMWPRAGMFGRPTPYLDNVVRRDGALLLGAGYNIQRKLLQEYRLSKGDMLIPGENETFTKTGALTVHRAGAGFDPGDEYVVVGDRLLKAGHDHHDSMPTVGAHGGLAWSTPRDWLSDTFSKMTEVDTGLLAVIERLQAYEPAAE